MKLLIHRNGIAEAIEVDGWVCCETTDWAIGSGDSDTDIVVALRLSRLTKGTALANDLCAHALDLAEGRES